MYCDSNKFVYFVIRLIPNLLADCTLDYIHEDSKLPLTTHFCECFNNQDLY